MISSSHSPFVVRRPWNISGALDSESPKPRRPLWPNAELLRRQRFKYRSRPTEMPPRYSSRCSVCAAALTFGHAECLHTNCRAYRTLQWCGRVVFPAACRPVVDRGRRPLAQALTPRIARPTESHQRLVVHVLHERRG